MLCMLKNLIVPSKKCSQIIQLLLNKNLNYYGIKDDFSLNTYNISLDVKFYIQNNIIYITLFIFNKYNKFKIVYAYKIKSTQTMKYIVLRDVYIFNYNSNRPTQNNKKIYLTEYQFTNIYNTKLIEDINNYFNKIIIPNIICNNI